MQNDSYLRFKKYFLLVFFVLFFFKVQSQEINWISLEEVVEFQKTKPKNVIIDVYTNWCGPCKLMDKNTFSNPEIVDFINKNYYAVKFNAEGNQTVSFMDRIFKNPNYDSSRAQKRNSSHEFTRFLGINAYPSTLFFDSHVIKDNPSLTENIIIIVQYISSTNYTRAIIIYINLFTNCV